MPATNSKLVVILGPTASGKSSLAIELAQKFNGEIISADSRQVYKGMDLGSGKITKAEQRIVPHYLIDVAEPNEQFTVSDFKKLATEAVADIQSRGKLPFVVGGSAFYIYNLTDDWVIPEVSPDPALRAQLDKLSETELFAELKKLDPHRAETIDARNKVRLIRALEIINTTGVPVPVTDGITFKTDPNKLFLGINKDPAELKKLIAGRLDARFQAGMIEEIKILLGKVGPERLDDLGLEYRYVASFVHGHLTFLEMRQQLLAAISNFARRQMTWFKRDNRIHWINDAPEAEQLVKNFLES